MLKYLDLVIFQQRMVKSQLFIDINAINNMSKLCLQIQKRKNKFYYSMKTSSITCYILNFKKRKQ